MCICDTDASRNQGKSSKARKCSSPSDSGGIDLLPDLGQASGYDAVVGAVQHREYADLSAAELAHLVAGDGVVADIKGMWRHLTLPSAVKRWQL